jgi:hypothetical protein
MTVVYVPKIIADATDIETIICLTVLVGAGKIPVTSSIRDAQDFFDTVDGCDNCPLKDVCLACLINQS